MKGILFVKYTRSKGVGVAAPSAGGPPGVNETVTELDGGNGCTAINTNVYFKMAKR